MAQPLSSTLPGIHPLEKERYTFSNLALDDGNVTLTPSNLPHGLISMTPTASRTLTLPSANTIVATRFLFTGHQVSEAVPFIVRNQAAAGAGFNLTIAMPGDASIVADAGANLIVPPGTFTEYVLRMDDVNPESANGTLFQVNSGASDGGASGAAYLSAEAAFAMMNPETTVMTAGTAVEFANLTFTVGAGVAPAVGITLVAPVMPITSTSFEIANSGIYKVDASVSGAVTGGNSRLIFVVVAIDGVPIEQNLCALGNDTAGTDPHADNKGSIILPVAAGERLRLFLDASDDGTVLTPEQVSIAIQRLA